MNRRGNAVAAVLIIILILVTLWVLMQRAQKRPITPQETSNFLAEEEHALRKSVNVGISRTLKDREMAYGNQPIWFCNRPLPPDVQEANMTFQDEAWRAIRAMNGTLASQNYSLNISNVSVNVNSPLAAGQDLREISFNVENVVGGPGFEHLTSLRNISATYYFHYRLWEIYNRLLDWFSQARTVPGTTIRGVTGTYTGYGGAILERLEPDIMLVPCKRIQSRCGGCPPNGTRWTNESALDSIKIGWDNISHEQLLNATVADLNVFLANDHLACKARYTYNQTKNLPHYFYGIQPFLLNRDFYGQGEYAMIGEHWTDVCPPVVGPPAGPPQGRHDLFNLFPPYPFAGIPVFHDCPDFSTLFPLPESIQYYAAIEYFALERQVLFDLKVTCYDNRTIMEGFNQFEYLGLDTTLKVRMEDACFPDIGPIQPDEAQGVCFRCGQTEIDNVECETIRQDCSLRSEPDDIFLQRNPTPIREYLGVNDCRDTLDWCEMNC